MKLQKDVKIKGLYEFIETHGADFGFRITQEVNDTDTWQQVWVIRPPFLIFSRDIPVCTINVLDGIRARKGWVESLRPMFEAFEKQGGHEIIVKVSQ